MPTVPGLAGKPVTTDGAVIDFYRFQSAYSVIRRIVSWLLCLLVPCFDIRHPPILFDVPCPYLVPFIDSFIVIIAVSENRFDQVGLGRFKIGDQGGQVLARGPIREPKQGIVLFDIV
jgi:hypothetical protein